MKFSMIFEAQMTDPSAAHERQVLRDCVAQAVLAEEMGFDTVWAVEHHGLKWYAHMSAPEIFLTWVAARTERIRLGHGVVCMPFNFNHPVRAAERAAMLDVLSNGRVNLGAGRGATPQETSMCGVDPERTYQEVEEALRIIGRAWQDPEGEFEWHGELLDIDPHPLLPRPVQLPHPPLFMACTKKETLQLAADYGIGALVLGFAGVEEIAELRRTYDRAIAARTGRNLSLPWSTTISRPCARPWCWRIGSGRSRSAHAGSGSSPSRSSTGTARARCRTRRWTGRWTRSRRSSRPPRSTWRTCTRRRSR